MNTQKLIPRSEVLEWLGVSRQTVDAWVKRGRFPPPVRFGKVSGGWIPEELSAWEQERIAERDAAPKAA